MDELTNIVALSWNDVTVKLPLPFVSPVAVVPEVSTLAVAGATELPPFAIILTTVNVSECFKYSSAACDVKN